MGHFHTTNDFTPSKLPLPAKIWVDDALVKGSSVGILRSARFIKAVLVRQKHYVDATVICRERFHLESSMLRRMRAKNMAFPISE